MRRITQNGWGRLESVVFQYKTVWPSIWVNVINKNMTYKSNKPLLNSGRQRISVSQSYVLSTP